MPEWIVSVVHGIVGAVVFTTGVNAAGSDLRAVFRQPGLLFRALFAVLVVVPAIAVLLARSSAVPRDVAAALLVLAVSIGPIAAFKQAKRAGGDTDLALGLGVVFLVLSLGFVPLAVSVVGALFGRDLHLGVGPVAKVMVPLELAPLVAGLALGALAPRLVARFGKGLTRVTNAAFAAVVLLVAVTQFKALIALGSTRWLMIAAFSVLAVLTGHVFGGPAERTRMVVAALASARFPALALLLVQLSAQPKALLPLVVAYFICSTVVLAIYFAVGRFTRHEPQAAPAR